MSKTKSIHYVTGARFHASCDGNKRMTPGRFSYTDVKTDVTCKRCLKMIAAGDARRAATTAKEAEVNAEFAARCLVQR